MTWKFWKRRHPLTVQTMGGECDHLWTNWDNPSEVTVSIPASMFSAQSRSDSVLVQYRHCLTCNYYQRRAL